MQTELFCAGDLKQSKVLVIGHDPRLQKSYTQASYTLFADYFFKPIPTKKNELAKYKLAEATFGYITYLSSYKYRADQIVLTNLCNSALPHAPKGKTVHIPETEAENGVKKILEILEQSNIEVVFAMSQQVNYWLQNFKLCTIVDKFIDLAEPNQRGFEHNPPYYMPKQSKAFQIICGKSLKISNTCCLIPILHIKNWPLRGNFVNPYKKSYENIVNSLKPNIL